LAADGARAFRAADQDGFRRRKRPDRQSRGLRPSAGEEGQEAVICEIIGLCSYEGCEAPATHIAKGRYHDDDKPRHIEVAVYCGKHADLVAQEGYPEYEAECPNCHCQFGVN
jgi:hypothetical protein